jgi:hypothetical protein
MADPAALSNLGASSNAATAPAFADAGQTAQNQQQALLAAIAQAGQAGKQQFASAQSANAADRQAALQAATQREAVVQNMPPALAQQLGVQTATPYNQSQDLLGQSQQSFQQNIAQEGQAAGNYLGEVKASIPVVQADVQGKVAALQAAAQAKQAQDAQALQIAQLQTQAEQARLQQAQLAANPASDLGKAVTAGGGVQLVGTTLANQLAASPQEQAVQSAAQSLGITPPTTGPFSVGGKNALAAVAQQNNLSPDQAQALMDVGNIKTTQAQQNLTNSQLAGNIKELTLARPTNTTQNNDPRAGLARGYAQSVIDNALSSGQSVDPSQVAAYIVAKLQNPPLSLDTAEWAVNQALAAAKAAAAAGVNG